MFEWRSVDGLRGDQRALQEQQSEKQRLLKTQRTLFAMISMVGVFAVAEFALGIVTGSLAILADAFHMISDMLALVVGVVAVRLASRPRTVTHTYGFKRAETIGALANSVFLLAVVMFIVVDAIERFVEGSPLDDTLSQRELLHFRHTVRLQLHVHALHHIYVPCRSFSLPFLDD